MFEQQHITQNVKPIFTGRTAIGQTDHIERPYDSKFSVTGRVLAYCAAGTFGLISPAYVNATSATSSSYINKINIQDSTSTKKSKDSLKDLAYIMKLTRLSVTELSKIFGVSRQSVYEWLRSGTISLKNSERISSFAQSVDLLTSTDILINPQLLRRKVVNGVSLLDAVKRKPHSYQLKARL